MMGYASYRIYTIQSLNGSIDLVQVLTNSTQLKWYGIQLALNFIYTPILFNLQNLSLASVEIGFLWVGIVGTIQSFAEIDNLAAYLLVPYLGWVSFASYLTLWLWKNNRKTKGE